MKVKKVVLSDPKKTDYFYEEAIKTLRTNLQFCGSERKSILVTSCLPNEGKSDITFQLAVEIGKTGKRVLILDADIRRSCYLSRYQVKEKVRGLSEFLSGQCRLEDILYETNYEGVYMIFAGKAAPNPTELLEQEQFAKLLQGLRDIYDYILVDTPPVGSIIDAAVAARDCDGAIFVIASGQVSRKLAIKAREQLEKAGCRILGVVLNKVNVRKNKYYSKYYSKYNSYYRSGH